MKRISYIITMTTACFLFLRAGNTSYANEAPLTKTEEYRVADLTPEISYANPINFWVIVNTSLNNEIKTGGIAITIYDTDFTLYSNFISKDEASECIDAIVKIEGLTKAFKPKTRTKFEYVSPSGVIVLAEYITDSWAYYFCPNRDAKAKNETRLSLLDLPKLCAVINDCIKVLDEEIK